MPLQQLRFLIAVAESGSINAAAQRLYTAQSNISNAVKSLEQELHLEIFTRSSRGVTLTNDGTELLGYARQVVAPADMLEARYEDGGPPQARLAISAQHYAFSVEAFVNVVERCRDSKFEFALGMDRRLGIVAVHDCHVVSLHIIQVTRHQHGECRFAGSSLLGGEGDEQRFFFHAFFFFIC